MSKTYKIFMAIFLLLIAVLTYLEATEKEPVNWNSSYSAKDKIALGTYVFYESWKNAGPQKIKEFNTPPFEVLKDSIDTRQGTYFFLNSNVVFDKSELKKFLNWVEKGNTLFVAASYFGKNFLDTLKLETRTYTGETNFNSKPIVNFTNPLLRAKEGYLLDHDINTLYFNKIDTLHTLVLGKVHFQEKGEEASKAKINFIEKDFGKGKIYLNTIPQAFSNYFLLTKNNSEYAEKSLAYLPQHIPVFWDSYYKDGKAFYTSPLYILLNTTSLKWAYYVIILASVLFIIFEGKRKQRPIPVLSPLKNKSYAYAQSIANLYVEQKRYKELAEQKRALFLEYIRSKYRISTQEQNEEFYQLLSTASGNSLEKTQAIFKKLKAIDRKSQCTAQEFLALSQEITNYKKNTHGK